MAQSLHLQEAPLYGLENASKMASDGAHLEAPTAARLTAFSPTVMFGFSLIVLFVLAKAFGLGNKQKLPPGVKRLPRQWGESAAFASIFEVEILRSRC
jgi:hypothetical protein